MLNCKEISNTINKTNAPNPVDY